MLDKTKIAKTVIGAIAGMGASTIVKSIIKTNVTPTKKYDIVLTVIGTFVLGWMASETTEKFVHEKIDFVVKQYKNFELEHNKN